MLLAKNLAELHSFYGVYSSEALHSKSGNILNELYKYEEFDYLNNFYNHYIKSYDDTITLEINDKRARSKDLFFIGENVIKTAYSKFFFVFEGSLSPTEKLSITVLSHLWLTGNDELIKEFCGKDKWWTLSNYLNAKEKLNITKEFADDSYVTDAIRIGSNEAAGATKEMHKLNQELIYAEIILLKPKLVICVGKTAQDILGMRYLNQDTKFHAVKFPKYHNETGGYKELLTIMENI